MTPEILEMVHDADVWIDDRKIAIAESEWLTFQLMPTRALSRFLLNCAEHIELGKYKRHPRGPKKPVPKRTS